MGDPNLCKTLSPRVTGIQIKSCRKTVSAGSHHAPLLLDNCHLPLLPQLLHPSPLPVAPVFSPSSPLLGCTLLQDTQHRMCFKDFFKQRMGNEEGSAGSWEGSVTKGKESMSCQNRGKYGVYIKTVQVVHFYPVNRAANLAEGTHLKACKWAQWPGTVRLVSLCDTLLNVMCHHKS